MTGRLRVGCSGYDYPEWDGAFYPEGASPDDRFRCYAEQFDTVEVNATFYGLPDPSTVAAWRRRAPEGFTYAVKLSQYGTHRKKLKDPDQWLARFIEAVGGLGPTLGPVLCQLPPRWRANPERLEEFLAAARGDLRWAVEVRDPSWLTDAVYEVLERHGAALVIHDLIPDHPRVVTADWMYLRLHGPDPDHPYRGSYPHQRLSGLARRVVRHLDEGRDVYVYLNNDVGAAAPGDAERLRSSVEQVQ